jgi:hypothetical protein
VAVVVDLAYVPEIVALLIKVAVPADVTAAERAAPLRRVLDGTITPEEDA